MTGIDRVSSNPTEEPRLEPATEGPRRLVVGYDSSAPATRAARLAIALAVPRAGSVWFVHASETDRRRAEPLTEEELLTPFRAVSQAMVGLVSEARSQGVTGHVESREGAPAELVLAVAQEVDADLIVVGTRGHASPSRVLLGSVSAHVLAHANVPVVVVP